MSRYEEAVAEGWARVAGIRLGEMPQELADLHQRVEVLGIACACIGPPFCCSFRNRQTLALRYEAWRAHDVMVQVRDRMSRKEPTP